MSFYKNHAKDYAKSTFNDVFAINTYNNIKEFLPKNKEEPILEIGSGSGRDASFLTHKGYNVIAYDASKEMVNESQLLTGLNIFKVGDAQTFSENTKFNFIFANASLLHLNEEDFSLSIHNIFNHLSATGIFYFTVKKGFGEEIDSMGRFFKYYNKNQLINIFNSFGYSIQSINENQDLTRPDTYWLSIVAKH